MNEKQMQIEPSQKQAEDQLANGRFAKGNKLGRRYQPGQSGNPGGNHRRTPKVSHAYARLLAMTAAELEAFVPANGAEILAWEQFKSAMLGAPKDSLAAAKEITDRVEGKAKAVIETTKAGDELELLVGRIQERVRAATGQEMTRAEVIERIRAFRPEMVEGYDG